MRKSAKDLDKRATDRAALLVVRQQAELGAAGIHCGKHRVARLMQAAGLHALHKRCRHPVTTNSQHSDPVAPNLSARDFTAPAPNKKYVLFESGLFVV